MAGDVAVLQEQAALDCVHAKPFPPAQLAQGQASNPAHGCLEKNRIGARSLDNYVFGIAVPDYLQRLVDNQCFLVKPGADQDPVSGIGLADCFRYGDVVGPAHRINYSGGRTWFFGSFLR